MGSHRCSKARKLSRLGLSRERFAALLFSPDGGAWSLQAVGEVFGQEGWIEAMAVGDDEVVAVFRPLGDGFPQNEEEARGYEPPAAQWWVGRLDN